MATVPDTASPNFTLNKYKNAKTTKQTLKNRFNIYL